MMLMAPRLSVLLALFLFVSAAAVTAQPNLSTIGPQIGARVPDFSAVDQFGRTQTLQSLAGPEGTMLVFFRSAEW